MAVVFTHIHRRNKHLQRGGAVSEFLITFPLLWVFLTGVLEGGRILAQIGWTMQTVYNSALYGIGIPEADQVVTKTTERAELLYDNSYNQQLSQNKSFSVETVYASQPDPLPEGWTASKNLKVGISASLNTILPQSYMPTTFHVYSVMPALVKEAQDIVDTFLSPVRYCANGQIPNGNGKCMTINMTARCNRNSYCQGNGNNFDVEDDGVTQGGDGGAGGGPVGGGGGLGGLPGGGL